MPYTVKEIKDDIIQILDSQSDGIYIVKGTEHSVVIDLGWDADNLKPLTDSLITTPYSVLFTHGHPDHTGRGEEFDSLYLDTDDNELYSIFNDMFRANGMNLPFADIERIKPLASEFSLGDRAIKVVKCKGHTPGSVFFVDEKNKAVFTGDAIGSGCNVWLQCSGALTVKEYREGLISAQNELIKLGVTDEWQFFGGHPGQEYQSRVSDYNPLKFSMIDDMIVLCDRLLSGENPYRESSAKEFDLGKPMYAAYKTAEMIFTLEHIK